jgi:hypothetical protein
LRYMRIIRNTSCTKLHNKADVQAALSGLPEHPLLYFSQLCPPHNICANNSPD